MLNIPKAWTLMHCLVRCRSLGWACEDSCAWSHVSSDLVIESVA